MLTQANIAALPPHLMRLTSGKMDCCCSSSIVSLIAAALAAASMMSGVICLAPAAMQPNPTPVPNSKSTCHKTAAYQIQLPLPRNLRFNCFATEAARHVSLFAEQRHSVARSVSILRLQLHAEGRSNESTWKDKRVVGLCWDIHAFLGLEGRKGGTTGVHSFASRPLVGLLSCTLSHFRGVGQGQHYGSAAPPPSALHTLHHQPWSTFPAF